MEILNENGIEIKSTDGIIDIDGNAVKSKTLGEIAVEELQIGWPRFLVAFLKQVQLKAGIENLSQEQLNEVQRAIEQYQQGGI